MGLKSSFASTKEDTSTDYAFDEDDAFDTNIDPDIDMLAAIVSRKKSLTGEHAKSMAKELKTPVRTCELVLMFMP
jgi:phosphohistidine swiveling domain-containing protein